MTPFATVDVSAVAAWLSAIPFEGWPQQHLLGGNIRPAMVTDPAWHGFGAVTDAIEREIVRYFVGGVSAWRALSVVMPGHAIPTHRDAQPDNWVCRVHVPITSNWGALFIVEDRVHRLSVSGAYAIDTRLDHAVVNGGVEPRVHLMIDIHRGYV